MIFSCHSREGGNPFTDGCNAHLKMDPRLRGDDNRGEEVNRNIIVKLSHTQYPIIVRAQCLSDHALLQQFILSQQVFIITNTKVAPYYLDTVKRAFAHLQTDVLILEDGEETKNQASLTLIYDTLLKYKHNRDTTIVALGGGVIGDLAGFAAATYQRGVRFIQIPTTLLAQVDAAIGGKTGINHAEAKNLIGNFYQPHAVLIDVDTLKTLPMREFKSGLAEVIKYALLQGGELLATLQECLTPALTPNATEVLSNLIFQCCLIKKHYVEQDELERSNQRALLNLGHTFGHALEALTHYQRWLHGEAVAIGLYCAALLSYKLGSLSQKKLNQVDSLLKCAALPSRIPRDIDLNALQLLMMNDKKVKNKMLHFILMRDFGDCYVENRVSAPCLRQVLLSTVEGGRHE